MIERVIENWLINSNERGYQIPFCQLLSLKGYKIVHVSTHGPFEQGKDIITIDPEGLPCAFQLKAGDISLDRWRKIRPEVEELLDIPIIHPSVDKSIPHRSFLVTTGTLSDPVRREIDDRNDKRKRENKTILETIVKGQLSQDFVNVNEKFFPKEISNIQLFLNLYTYDGTNPLPKDKITEFLSIIFSLDEKLNKKDIVRLSSNALIFSGYVLSPYERSKNYWSLADGWIITTAYLIAMAEKHNSFKEIGPTIKLSLKAVEDALSSLQKEALESPDLMQGGSLFEGMVFPFRATILIGYLAAFRLFILLNGGEDWRDDRIVDFYKKYEKDIKLFSEGSVPLFLSLFWYFKKTGKKEDAYNILMKLVNTVIQVNRDQKVGLISPYYDVETVIRNYMGLLDEPIYETFADNSYSLDSLVTLIARSNMKNFLASKWRPITHIHLSEFVSKFLWETFLYRAEHGKLKSKFPNQKQSWSKLVKEAKKIDKNELPKGLKKYPQFLILLLLVFPHRMRPIFVKFFDDVINKA